jgi:hypothetical protein
MAAADERRDWFVHTYVAQVTFTRFLEVVRFDTDLGSSWLVAAGAGRRLTDLGRYAQMEWEVQVVQHWGMQHHQELNAFLAARWVRFPWDRYVDTSLAFGMGWSHAVRVPAIEAERHDVAGRNLIYLMAEIGAAPPSWRDWSVFVRVHHRSGGFDVVTEAGGSNFVGLGLRRHF